MIIVIHDAPAPETSWLVEAITEKLAKEQQNTAEGCRPHV